MILWKRALLLGLWSWLTPLVVSMPLFPLKQADSPLFESTMTLVVLVTAGILTRAYFRGRPISAGEAVRVGLLWALMNFALDYPMFSYGPMKTTAAKYYSEIGVDYLIYPIFGFLAALLAQREERRSAAA